MSNDGRCRHEARGAETRGRGWRGEDVKRRPGGRRYTMGEEVRSG